MCNSPHSGGFISPAGIPMIEFIPSVYQLIGLGFACVAVALFFPLFGRAVFQLIRGYFRHG